MEHESNKKHGKRQLAIWQERSILTIPTAPRLWNETTHQSYTLWKIQKNNTILRYPFHMYSVPTKTYAISYRPQDTWGTFFKILSWLVSCHTAVSISADYNPPLNSQTPTRKHTKNTDKTYLGTTAFSLSTKKLFSGGSDCAHRHLPSASGLAPAARRYLPPSRFLWVRACYANF